MPLAYRLQPLGFFKFYNFTLTGPRVYKDTSHWEVQYGEIFIKKHNSPMSVPKGTCAGFYA